MNIRIIAAAAMLLASTSLAQAAWDQNQTVLDLQAQGYTHIEITLSATQAKVEASNGTSRIETIYDLATGDVISTETAPDDETLPPGVVVEPSKDDSLDDADEQGDDEDSASGSDDHGDDQADDGDHGDDSGDDGEDDHGGDSGDGGDDSGGDDSGDGGDAD